MKKISALIVIFCIFEALSSCKSSRTKAISPKNSSAPKNKLTIVDAPPTEAETPLEQNAAKDEILPEKDNEEPKTPANPPNPPKVQSCLNSTCSASLLIACQNKDKLNLSQQAALRLLYKKTQAQNCSELASTTQSVESIDLSHSQLKDISLLRFYKELTQLDLSNNLLMEYHLTLPKLVQLDLSNNPLKEVSFGLESPIEHLNLQHTTFKNIYKVYKLKNLKTLQASNTRFIDWEHFTHNKLKTLTLNDAGISQLSFLKSLPKLEMLSLNNNLIKEIKTLEILKNLSFLSLDNNHIRSISPLENHPQLISLSIKSNELKQINELNTIASLKYLFLDQNPLKEIGPLSAISNLQELSLRNLPITSLSSIHNLKQLKILDVRDCPLKDKSFPIHSAKFLFLYTP